LTFFFCENLKKREYLFNPNTKQIMDDAIREIALRSMKNMSSYKGEDLEVKVLGTAVILEWIGDYDQAMS